MNQGFTLIELMVAISIFAIVAVIATGAVLSANNVNQQAQAIKLTMDNLNFALDSMTLKLKSGGGYYCDPSTTDPPTYPTDVDSKDCSTGGSAIAFKKADLNPDGSQDKYIYRLSNQHLQFSQNGSSFTNLTSDDISIQGLRFYVVGNNATDQQPRVLVSIYGQARAGHQSSTFAVETTVSDRR